MDFQRKLRRAAIIREGRRYALMKQNFIIFLHSVAELSEFLSSQDFYIALRETPTALGMFSLLIFD
ncbi:hypothetical protein BFS05_00490 [Gardnerella vaginalis]|uniref:Uncharacterized protein n=1 Tax=Gardnerella vaginalis TaxID=2702 RepID=A0A2K1SW47_GARVA|nr:hypothetical protein BFS05_00490 [Gardnerella vaginalis]